MDITFADNTPNITFNNIGPQNQEVATKTFTVTGTNTTNKTMYYKNKLYYR